MNEEKKLKITERRQQIDDLDMLPWLDRGLIDYKKYLEYAGQSGMRYEMTIQGTRGCPYKCFYCDVQHITPYHRRRSVQNIVDEVKYLNGIGVRRTEVIDDAFNVNIKQFKEFFRSIINNRLDMSFYFQSGLRGDLLDVEAIDLMYEGGVKGVNLSLESASPRLQKMMKKNLNIDKLYNNLQYIAENYPHITLGLNGMFGFPTETEEEAMQTINFIKSIKWLHFAQLHNVRIFPGSLLETIALENGVTKEQINESITIPYHLMPTTIHFDAEFSRKARLDFICDYIFSKERLKYILRVQIESGMSELELLYKYQTIFPAKINSMEDVLRLGRIKKEDVGFDNISPEQSFTIDYPPPPAPKSQPAVRLLLIDASQYFKKDVQQEVRAASQPLGLMSLLTFLNKNFGDLVEGKIMKSGIDFDSLDELESIVKSFNPNMIGIRTLSYFKNFYAEMVRSIRMYAGSVPIIAGGPHPTIAFEEVLRETDTQIVCIGEGELIMSEIVEKFIENKCQMPTVEQLRDINGIAFLY